MSKRAQATGSSRTSISNHTQRVVQAVVNKQAGGVSYEALGADNTRLRAGNGTLWETWIAIGQLPDAKQQEFAATGSAMGLSLGQIIC